MRLVMCLLLLFAVGNIKTGLKHDEKKPWKAVWNYLIPSLKTHPDTGSTITEYLKKYNYPLEEHYVTTEDGYIIAIHRIPKHNATAILFGHCLACSAMDFLFLGPNNSLPLLLADQGYDVWLLNMRGNAYSLNHTTLSADRSSFWNFSFHEKGMYDLPAAIDYILRATKLEKITYVGHSQGTTTALVLTSSKPEYNAKLNLMVFLSPVAFWGHMTSPMLQLFLNYETALKVVLELFNIYAIPPSKFINQLGEIVCNEYSSLQNVCIFLIEIFAGFDIDQIDRVKLPAYLSHTPSGTSIKEISHFLQEIKSDRFRQYDYGSVENLQRYGSSTPPNYNLAQVTAPLAVYYAKNDYLASTTDVEHLMSNLTNSHVIDQWLIEYDLFNHLDFVMGKDAKTLLYDRVIKVINENSPV